MKSYISERIIEAITALHSTENQMNAEAVFDVTNPKSEFGDYATNAAMVLFKKLEVKPAENPALFAKSLAAKISELDTEKNFSQVVAVGGFINIFLSRSALLKQLEIFSQNLVPHVKNNQTIIIDYFQNNVAKPPHIGHLRSAVVGDSLARIFEWSGYTVISDTHVGDWGVQFGILLYAFKTMGNKAVVEQNPIAELNALYVALSQQIKEQPQLRDAGKAEFKKLEAGDPENVALWQWFVAVSLQDFERYKKMLHLRPFQLDLGESAYQDDLQKVLAEFTSKGLVVTGAEGEQYVDLEDYKLGRCILMKSDGATTYHLRDFAAYLHRKKEFNFYKNLYVVDVRQSHHFKQLFKVLELAGYPAQIDSVNVSFGFMSLPEGPISTRGGTVISLEALLSQANQKAEAIIAEKNPDLPDAQRVAREVALAAVKYFDLSHNRNSDITFTWEKALSFEGNTGPYIQYAHARICSILRKISKQDQTTSAANAHESEQSLELHQNELALLRKLFFFNEVVEQITYDYLPSQLCQYLFELAGTFNSFYQTCPVLTAPAAEQAFRLQLCQATKNVLAQGLALLGIAALEEM